MYEMYENGELPDIRGLTPDLQNGVTLQEALFADPLLGHGGPMMVEVAALVWMELLYGADVDSLTYTDYETDVAAIVNQVVAYNQQFAVPEPGSFVLFGGALVGRLVLGRRRGHSHRMQTSLAVLIGAISLSFAGPAPAQQDHYMVSAFFGLDDAFPTMGNVVFLPTSNPWNAQTGNPTRSNPTGADLTGLDGMPIVFSESLNPATVDPSDFLITTASGVTYTPSAATINPAFEPGERHTVLLAGQFGTVQSGSNPGDPPLTVSLVGSLLTFDGVPIAPQSVDPVSVTPLEDGPSLVYAKPVDVAPASPDFVSGSELVLMAIWDGGIEATDGNEVTDDEWTQYVLRGFDAIGNAVELTPFAIGDLNDNDNNHLLYFDEKIVPDTLILPGGLVIDPRGDVNTDTSVSVIRPRAVPEPGSLTLGAIAFLLAAWQVRRAD